MNTTEIISKVTITLSLINSNKDFDFVGLVYIKTPCLFYFRSVKFHYVKETHDINSLLTLVKIVLASQHKRQPNKSLSRFVDNSPRSIYQYSSMAPRLSGQNCKFFKFLLSLNSQRRLLDTKETTPNIEV